MRKLIRLLRGRKKSAKGNDFAKIFKIPDGQVLIEVEYPVYMGEPFVLVQSTVVNRIVKGKISTDYPTDIQLREAFNSYNYKKAVEFNKQIQGLL